MRNPVLKLVAATLAAVAVVVIGSDSPKPAGALFHFAVIDEVMAGYDGDPNIQYIEIRQTSAGQNLVAHSIIGYFNAAGVYQGDILEMPADVPSGSNLRWIVGTPQYATASGIQPEFTFPPVAFPATGMICFGGGTGILPLNPPTWDRTNMANWVDCVPYGGYSATPNKYGSCPAAPNCSTPFGLGNGTNQSLTRVSITNNPPVDWGLGPCTSATSNRASLGFNNDNHVDLPQSKAFDDLTWPNSDLALDNCGVSPDTDDDNDGLPDATETGGPPCGSATAPTNPIEGDTDGDRFLDGAECGLGFDPASAASVPATTACGAVGDPDADKIQTRLEVCFYNSNPNSNDSDGDAAAAGAKDGCEMASINADRIVNSIDQGVLAGHVGASTPGVNYIVNFDFNKDGTISSIDQGMMASFIVPAGQCP
jgi:hypothetical protein